MSNVAITDLINTIRECLITQVKTGFDANAELTLDIARQVAIEVEHKCKGYTDSELSKLADDLEQVDLQPLKDFIVSLKLVLDGDDETEGFQIFDLLLNDIVSNKQTLIEQGEKLSGIVSSLTLLNGTISDHDDRIVLLEQIDHSAIAEARDNEILGIISTAMQNACSAAHDTIMSYMANESKSYVELIKSELSRNVFANLVITKSNEELLVTGKIISNKVESVSVLYTNSETGVTMINNSSEFTILGGDSSINGNVIIQAKDTDNVDVGSPYVYQYVS